MTYILTNKDRASKCEKALASYAADPFQEALIDLLTDAMHWCDHNGEDFHLCLAMAGRHYINELNDMQGDERRMP
jgi:hypothetical protein